ncbi:MAG: DUF3575 domain-containing protein [Bacteroidales bacterium]|nr:DUF3575 domain-containing protein [Bacteroidales bacterium]
MRKVISCIVISMLLTGSLFAQTKEASEKNNLFSLSMTRLPLSNFYMGYERMFQNNTSIALNGGLILKDNTTESKIGTNLEFQYRFYSKIRREKVFQGIYFAPYLSYRYVDVEEKYSCYEDFIWINNAHQIYKTLGAGVGLGCKVAIAQKIVFGFEMGAGVKYSTGRRDYVDYNIFDYGYTGIAPKADITLGIFF